MVVNNGGNLSVEYFISYLNLVMQAKQCSLSCAKQDMLVKSLKGIRTISVLFPTSPLLRQ